MSTLQAIPTQHGIGILNSELKNTVTKYRLIGALTHDAPSESLTSFYENTIETSYYDDSGVLTFILNLPIEKHFDEYLHQIHVLDSSNQSVIECSTPKVALPKGIGGMVTLKAAISGEAGQVIFKHSEFVTERELIEVYFSNTFTGSSKEKAVTEKALKDGLEDVKSRAMIRTGPEGKTDPNALTESGSYRLEPHENNPTDDYYAVVVFGNQVNVIGQIATHISNGKIYYRSYNNKWSTWKHLTETEALMESMVGMVVPFHLEGEKRGWVDAKGGELSRIVDKLLWDYASASGMVVSQTIKDADPITHAMKFGDGDGSTTFTVPNHHLGHFTRGNPIGIEHGAVQGDAIRNLTGSLVLGSIVGRYDFSGVDGVFEKLPSSGGELNSGTSSYSVSPDVKFDASKVVPTSEENRPHTANLSIKIHRGWM